MSTRLEKLLLLKEENPEDSFIKFALAKEYHKAERLDLTLFYYTDIRDKDPKYIGVYLHLGQLYEEIQEQQLALKTYKDGIQLAKTLVDFHSMSELNNAKTNLEITLSN